MFFGIFLNSVLISSHTYKHLYLLFLCLYAQRDLTKKHIVSAEHMNNLVLFFMEKKNYPWICISKTMCFFFPKAFCLWLLSTWLFQTSYPCILFQLCHKIFSLSLHSRHEAISFLYNQVVQLLAFCLFVCLFFTFYFDKWIVSCQSFFKFKK